MNGSEKTSKTSKTSKTNMLNKVNKVNKVNKPNSLTFLLLFVWSLFLISISTSIPISSPCFASAQAPEFCRDIDPCEQVVGRDILFVVDVSQRMQRDPLQNTDTQFGEAFEFMRNVYCAFDGSAGSQAGLIYYGPPGFTRVQIPLQPFTVQQWANNVEALASRVPDEEAVVGEGMNLAVEEMKRNRDPNNVAMVFLITAGGIDQRPTFTLEGPTSGDGFTGTSPRAESTIDQGVPFWAPWDLCRAESQAAFDSGLCSKGDLLRPTQGRGDFDDTEFNTKVFTPEFYVGNFLAGSATELKDDKVRLIVLGVPDADGDVSSLPLWSGVNENVDCLQGLGGETEPQPGKWCKRLPREDANDPTLYCACVELDGPLASEPASANVLASPQSGLWNVTGLIQTVERSVCLTLAPTPAPTTSPTVSPTYSPTLSPTPPTPAPTPAPSPSPSKAPTKQPTMSPTPQPTASPTNPTPAPTPAPSPSPSVSPSKSPTLAPSPSPTFSPTPPTAAPTKSPTRNPTVSPSKNPTLSPTFSPSRSPTKSPSKSPSFSPSISPTVSPTKRPTTSPTPNPTFSPTTTDSPTILFDPDTIVIYGTEGTTDGDLGGVEGATDACNDPNNQPFGVCLGNDAVPILCDSTSDPTRDMVFLEPFTSSELPVVIADGPERVPFATSWVSMFESGILVDKLADVGWTGARWTGCEAGGTHSINRDCNGWSFNRDNAYAHVMRGGSTNTGPGWTQAGLDMSCGNNNLRLMCACFSRETLSPTTSSPTTPTTLSPTVSPTETLGDTILVFGDLQPFPGDLGLDTAFQHCSDIAPSQCIDPSAAQPFMCSSKAERDMRTLLPFANLGFQVRLFNDNDEYEPTFPLFSETWESMFLNGVEESINLVDSLQGQRWVGCDTSGETSNNDCGSWSTQSSSGFVAQARHDGPNWYTGLDRACSNNLRLLCVCVGGLTERPTASPTPSPVEAIPTAAPAPTICPEAPPERKDPCVGFSRGLTGCRNRNRQLSNTECWYNDAPAPHPSAQDFVTRCYLPNQNEWDNAPGRSRKTCRGICRHGSFAVERERSGGWSLRTLGCQASWNSRQLVTETSCNMRGAENVWIPYFGPEEGRCPVVAAPNNKCYLAQRSSPCISIENMQACNEALNCEWGPFGTQCTERQTQVVNIYEDQVRSGIYFQDSKQLQGPVLNESRPTFGFAGGVELQPDAFARVYCFAGCNKDFALEFARGTLYLRQQCSGGIDERYKVATTDDMHSYWLREFITPLQSPASTCLLRLEYEGTGDVLLAKVEYSVTSAPPTPASPTPSPGAPTPSDCPTTDFDNTLIRCEQNPAGAFRPANQNRGNTPIPEFCASLCLAHQGPTEESPFFPGCRSWSWFKNQNACILRACSPEGSGFYQSSTVTGANSWRSGTLDSSCFPNNEITQSPTVPCEYDNTADPPEFSNQRAAESCAITSYKFDSPLNMRVRQRLDWCEEQCSSNALVEGCVAVEYIPFNAAKICRFLSCTDFGANINSEVFASAKVDSNCGA